MLPAHLTHVPQAISDFLLAPFHFSLSTLAMSDELPIAVPVLAYEPVRGDRHDRWAVWFSGLVMTVYAGWPLLGTMLGGPRDWDGWVVSVVLVAGMVAAVLARWRLAAAAAVLLILGSSAQVGATERLLLPLAGMLIGLRLMLARDGDRRRPRRDLSEVAWRSWHRFRASAVGVRARLPKARRRREARRLGKPALLAAAIYMVLLPLVWHTPGDWRYETLWLLPETLAAWVAASGFWLLFRDRGEGQALQILSRTAGLMMVANALAVPTYVYFVITGYAPSPPDVFSWVGLGCVMLNGLSGLMTTMGVRWGLLAMAGSLGITALLALVRADVMGWGAAAWITLRGLSLAGLALWLWIKKTR